MTAVQSTADRQTNRRVTPRRQPTVGTVCRLALKPGTTDRLGLVWNISASGVSMFLDEPLEAGTLLPGVLATLEDQRTLPVTLRIVHVRPIRTGDYFLGAQFQQPLQPAQMQPFLAEPYVES